jgi:hypothetical protein
MQALPHPPQFAVLLMSVSQPLSALALQWAHPAAQEATGIEQAPEARHSVVPVTWGRFVQSWPHAPQFFGSVCSLTQAPPQGT